MKAARRALSFFVVYPACFGYLIPSDPFSMLFVLGFAEPVVLRRVGVSSMEFSKFLHSSFREVVEGFFCPVFSFRIVEPFDEV